MIYIQNLPDPMTKEEEQKLCQNLNDENRKILVEKNMRLAINIANSFSNVDMEHEDLISICFLNLVKASKKFNPHLGYRFNTYAATVIKRGIFMEIRKMKIHPYPKESLNDICCSMNGEKYEKGSVIPSTFIIDDLIIENELKRTINSTVKNESIRNQIVIKMFLDGERQEDIKDTVGISQSYVSRIIKKFKNNLKNQYMD